LKAQPSAAKSCVLSVFWYKRGVIPVTSWNGPYDQFCSLCGDTEEAGNMNYKSEAREGKSFLKHDNARPHTNILTRETIAEFGWIVLPPLPYSSHLAMSDFQLVGPMKDGLCGRHFTNDSAVIVAIKKLLLEPDSSFHKRGIQASVQQSRKYIQSDGEYVEK
jgi:hypothetical protein